MNFNHAKPLTYLITAGRLPPDAHINHTNPEVARLLELIAAAIRAEVSFIQLREKALSARALYLLTHHVAALVRDSSTRLLVNDRADIAYSGGAHGVHLTTRSLDAHVVRRTFGANFLIGVSTHTMNEASAARDGGADFATFGPVFPTTSKHIYNLPPVGIEALRLACHALDSFPLLALGGIETTTRALACLDAGASGIAAIRLFNDATTIAGVAHAIAARQSSTP